MLINCTNHPSDQWGEEQRTAALAYGEIKDMAFPNISSSQSGDEVKVEADRYFERMIKMKPEAVLCMGEFVFTHHLVNRLKDAGVKVVASCSERRVVETHDSEGNTKKEVLFCFERFREY